MISSIARIFGPLRLRARLILTVFTATGLAIVGGAYLTIRYFDAKLFEVARQSTEADLDELRAVLEQQMVTADGSAFAALAAQIGRAPGVAWVGVVDDAGVVRVSSDHGRSSTRFGDGTPEQEALRTWGDSDAAAERARAHAYVHPECNVLRVMAPIANTERCWGCHDKGRRINGMLVIDRSLTPLRATVTTGATRIAFSGAIALIAVLACLGFVVERSVLRRLDRLRGAAHRLGSGDLAARARDPGADELGDVAREFDGMAARLQSALLEMAAQRGQLDQLVNGIADGVLLLDLDGRVVTMNRAFAARVGPEANVAGATYRELLRAAGADAEAGEAPAERALASGELEKAVLPVAGGERFEELYAQPLLGPEGRATAVIEVWRDITDRKVLEASVEQAERLASLGVLASSVAHEVGNPLASIVTAVDGLLTRLPQRSGGSPDEVRDYLELVRRQVFRCRSATERLLGFARVPAAGRDAVVDVAAAAREVRTLIAPQAAAQGVELELCAPDRALALAPDMTVEQVLLNLVLNALKAVPSGGKVRVEVAAEPGAVRLAVADTGHGIPAEVAKHLFQPFRTSRRDGRGTGLGLFISQALVQRSGGRIEVESTPGKGAVFTVRLRRAEVEARRRPPEQGAEAVT